LKAKNLNFSLKSELLAQKEIIVRVCAAIVGILLILPKYFIREESKELNEMKLDMKTRIIILFVIVFVQFPTTIFSNSYTFEKISPESGFVFGAINTITEDKNGFIWFGCDNGLYYYNTYKVEKYDLDSLQNGTKRSKVNKVYRDSSNVLWVCTDGGVCRFNSQTDSFDWIKFVGGPQKEGNLVVENFLQYKDSIYLLTSNNSLLKFNSNTHSLKTIPSFDQEISKKISFMDKSPGGTLLLGTADGMVFTAKSLNSPLEKFHISKPFPVQAVCIDGDKYYIGYEGNGVEVVNSSGKIVIQYKDDDSNGHLLPHNRVREIIKRNNGEIWIGTYKGILILDGEKSTIVRRDSYKGLPHNSIYTLYHNSDGSVWVGTWSGGLAYYSDYNYEFEHFKTIPNSRNDQSVISSFVEDKNNRIWVGCETLGISYFDIAQLDYNENPKLGALDQITRVKSLATSDGKVIWIGTFGQGLWQYNVSRRSLERIGNFNSLSDLLVSSINPQDNLLWLGTKGFGVYKYDTTTKKTTNYLLDSDKTIVNSPNRVWNTLTDTDGNLWVCTEGGIFTKEKGLDNFHRPAVVSASKLL